MIWTVGIEDSRKYDQTTDMDAAAPASSMDQPCHEKDTNRNAGNFTWSCIYTLLATYRVPSHWICSFVTVVFSKFVCHRTLFAATNSYSYTIPCIQLYGEVGTPAPTDYKTGLKLFHWRRTWERQKSRPKMSDDETCFCVVATVRS